MLKLIIRLILATIIVSSCFIITQDFQIFPGLYSSIIFNRRNVAPSDIETFNIKSIDHVAVHIWKKAAAKPRAYALLFHGNAEYLSDFVQVQRWLSSLDISSYAVEYRGYSGRDSGWPSESGFYQDAESAIKFLMQKENINADKIIVLGSSIGAGVASFIANKYQVNTLILLSPYSSLPALVSELPFFGYLKYFLKYHFPTVEYVAELQETCVILAHGEKDQTIPIEHSFEIKNRYQGNGLITLLSSAEAGHNDLLLNLKEKIAKNIFACTVR